MQSTSVGGEGLGENECNNHEYELSLCPAGKPANVLLMCCRTFSMDQCRWISCTWPDPCHWWPITAALWQVSTCVAVELIPVWWSTFLSICLMFCSFSWFIQLGQVIGLWNLLLHFMHSCFCWFRHLYYIYIIFGVLSHSLVNWAINAREDLVPDPYSGSLYLVPWLCIEPGSACCYSISIIPLALLI